MQLTRPAVVGVALLFTLAIRNVRRPNVHKRLILFAMLPILPPELEDLRRTLPRSALTAARLRHWAQALAALGEDAAAREALADHIDPADRLEHRRLHHIAEIKGHGVPDL